MRAQRDELLHTVHHPAWKVCPNLIAAVQEAVTEYHAARAPLYPLPPIQRLGYLDEQDTIECKLDLMGVPASAATQTDRGSRMEDRSEGHVSAPPLAVIFRAGERYSVRTQTVTVTRTSRKPNPFTGEPEDLEHTGQELAIYIRDGIDNPDAKETTLKEYCFMDAKIQADPHTAVRTGKSTRDAGDRVPIDFTLQQLADHFVIPEVPDVATNNPEGYKQNLERLAELEALTEALT
jgi:hypothetical protein